MQLLPSDITRLFKNLATESNPGASPLFLCDPFFDLSSPLSKAITAASLVQKPFYSQTIKPESGRYSSFSSQVIQPAARSRLLTTYTSSTASFQFLPASASADATKPHPSTKSQTFTSTRAEASSTTALPLNTAISVKQHLCATSSSSISDSISDQQQHRFVSSAKESKIPKRNSRKKQQKSSEAYSKSRKKKRKSSKDQRKSIDNHRKSSFGCRIRNRSRSSSPSRGSSSSPRRSQTRFSHRLKPVLSTPVLSSPHQSTLLQATVFQSSLLHSNLHEVQLHWFMKESSSTLMWLFNESLIIE